MREFGESNSNVATYTAPSAQKNFLERQDCCFSLRMLLLIQCRVPPRIPIEIVQRGCFTKRLYHPAVSSPTKGIFGIGLHLYYLFLSIQRALLGSAGKPTQMPLNLIGFATRLSLCPLHILPFCWRTSIRTMTISSKEIGANHYTIRQSNVPILLLSPK